MHFWVDKSRRRIRLDVKYVITATFLCPRGGVNAGSNMLLEMIHSMTHAVKRHRENVPLWACHSGRSPREQCFAAAAEHKGFFAHQRTIPELCFSDLRT